MSGLAKAFAMFTGASAIGSVTQVIKGKFTAVLLGAEGVGILNLLTSLWSLFSVLASLGFYNGLVRHLAPAWEAGEREQFRRHMSSNAFLLMTTACLLAALGCVFSEQLSLFLFIDTVDYAGLICLLLAGIPVFVAGQIYRAMLNAIRATSAVVRVRIAADVLSVVVLIALVYPFGLKGAVLGYIALHVIYLIFAFYFVRKVLGRDVVLPDPALFAPAEIRRNLGFGLNGLVAVSIGIVTTIIVSRWIIDSTGAAGNGLYMMALKVATVYMGGLSAAAGGYYFPTLAATRDDAEMFDVMNRTWSMYLYVLPPIIVLLMASGEWLMLLLFTAEFVPAAALLLLILPGDLFRVSAETVGMALIARKRLVISTGSYLVWAVLYLSLAYLLLPSHGILGVALAYGISQGYNAAQHLLISRLVLGYRPDRATLLSLLRGVGFLAASIALLYADLGTALTAGGTVLVFGVWGLLSCFDPMFKAGLRKLAIRVGFGRFF